MELFWEKRKGEERDKGNKKERYKKPAEHESKEISHLCPAP